MSQVVLTVSPSIMNEIKKKYNSHLSDKQPPGSIFVAKTPTCTITGYRSGKIMFQGTGAEVEAKPWQSSSTPTSGKSPAKKKVGDHQYAPPAHISTLSAIGSDEVGTGDFFGPITVAAAFVDKNQIPLLKELGVRDSKGMKDPEIIEIARNLIKTIPYSLMVLPNEKYNAMQKKGMNQGKMKALLHNQAIQNVQRKIPSYDAILIDQFAKPEIYFNYLKGQSTIVKEKVYFATKAEEIHLAVAAASIIARYSFVMEIDKLGKENNVKLPKGAGSAVDLAAAKLIQKHGGGVLDKLAKLHFANSLKAKKIAEKADRS
ncbi:ribonuclease HIII [Pseudalkalibacillus hwajinpoensis]|uniref:Ribonuclease HIII n=1 Tax=Guptibacillus hwajinpoensis TaxID=208199 RepID=A0A4U1MIM3_9BACL|nr:ribonuclease HIII [Pseudalkalibacillus hwajinpoensis]TKD70365.1 ribonuclease HIII [Pseudalkalibacillus hwajinpoensis]